MNKTICGIVLIAAIGTAVLLTGCDGKEDLENPKNGMSGMEQCAKADEITLLNGDADAYLNLVPQEMVEYWEDEYYVTRSQIIELINEWVRPKDEERIKELKNDIEKATIDDHSYEFGIKDVQDFNESEYYLAGEIKADEIHYISLSTDTDDSLHDCFVFLYNGRWYSLSAVESITDALN